MASRRSEAQRRRRPLGHLGQPSSEHGAGHRLARDEPIYFLLDRLETLDLGWHIDEGVLFLESLQESEKHRVTISYNLGGLFDAGFLSQPILDSIEQDIAGPWDLDEPGAGTLVLLGDVLFVRQHRKRAVRVAALLAAREARTADHPPRSAAACRSGGETGVSGSHGPFSESLDPRGSSATGRTSAGGNPI